VLHSAHFVDLARGGMTSATKCTLAAAPDPPPYKPLFAGPADARRGNA
jgi:hypothetical protein